MIRIQTEEFDVSAELSRLRLGRPDIGAIASFVGVVRDSSGESRVGAMTLEHYPEMTQNALAAIVARAEARWAIDDVTIIHRVGRLEPGDPIVLVAVAAAHRGAAFSACEFIMDYLKTEAPFWKKESTPEGERWVESRAADMAAAARWKTD